MNKKLIIVLALIVVLLFSSCSVLNSDDVVIKGNDGKTITGKELTNKLNDKNSDLSKALNEIKGEIKDHLDERSDYDAISQDLYGMNYDELVKSDKTGTKALEVVAEASRRHDKARGKKDHYFIPGSVFKQLMPDQNFEIPMSSENYCNYNPNNLLESDDLCMRTYSYPDDPVLSHQRDPTSVTYTFSDIIGVGSDFINLDYLRQDTINEYKQRIQDRLDNENYFSMDVPKGVMVCHFGDYVPVDYECYGLVKNVEIKLKGRLQDKDKSKLSHFISSIDFEKLDKVIESYTSGWDDDEYPLTI